MIFKHINVTICFNAVIVFSKILQRVFMINLLFVLKGYVISFLYLEFNLKNSCYYIFLQYLIDRYVRNNRKGYLTNIYIYILANTIIVPQ